MNLEKALAKITEEMGIFHVRLEKVEQHCLESIDCHLPRSTTLCMYITIKM